MKGVEVRSAVALLASTFLWAGPAAADLYRWVDPETGSVKFSSYPPPWYGNPRAAPRAPKVEVIAPIKTAPAFSREEADRAPAPVARRGERSDSRDALLKRLSQRIAAFVSSPPDGAAKPYAEMLEPLQDLEQAEKQAKPANPAEQAALLEERYQLAAPLEAHRVALTGQLGALQPPPPGTAPEAVEGLWRGTQQRMAVLEWTNEAMKVIDPRRTNARHFELRALSERMAEVWQPYVEAGFGRQNRAR